MAAPSLDACCAFAPAGPCWPLLAPAGPCWPLLAPAGPCWPLLARMPALMRPRGSFFSTGLLPAAKVVSKSKDTPVPASRLPSGHPAWNRCQMDVGGAVTANLQRRFASYRDCPTAGQSHNEARLSPHTCVNVSSRTSVSAGCLPALGHQSWPDEGRSPPYRPPCRLFRLGHPSSIERR
ncbi:hypothetical protein FA95DRAFT_333459 [Auriscalpium vulgare]|uniref:Uncharacterized protein n=1 Tax=Auriscalpium vulgare TaxID=40419 RepID=A0ACB8RIF3_9AGAM|nr:hypothetical protein FA95DRAFT_333459 [Auriscalpium vulgare]